MILPFPEAVERADKARTPSEIREVLVEVEERLGAANSALAVDSARTILRTLIESALPEA